MGESESDIQLGLPSSSQSVITGQLLEKTTCRPCKETFDSLKAYKKVIFIPYFSFFIISFFL